VSIAALLRVLPLERWPMVASHQCIKADLREGTLGITCLMGNYATLPAFHTPCGFLPLWFNEFRSYCKGNMYMMMIVTILVTLSISIYYCHVCSTTTQGLEFGQQETGNNLCQHIPKGRLHPELSRIWTGEIAPTSAIINIPLHLVSLWTRSWIQHFQRTKW